VRRIAWFGLGPLDAPSPYLEALRAELRDLGWTEGRNLTISRFTSTRVPEDFAVVVRDVVAAKPEVVVAQEFAALAMLRNQATLPVVFGFSGDPVEAKLVQSLSSGAPSRRIFPSSSPAPSSSWSTCGPPRLWASRSRH
jgi:putative ABC transport system substrate-binding protein